MSDEFQIHEEESESQTSIDQESEEPDHVFQTCNDHRRYVSRGIESFEVIQPSDSSQHEARQIQVL